MAHPPARWDLEVDLLAVGTSGGGLAAAIVGHDRGLTTAVIERGELVGGGMAFSAGVIWMPCNRQQLDAGQADSREAALTYVRNTGFGRQDEVKLKAYLERGPQALSYLEEHTPLRLAGGVGTDYFTEVEGSRPGRNLKPDPVGQPAALQEYERRYPLLGKVRHSHHATAANPNPASFTGGRGLVGALAAGCMERNIPLILNCRGRELVVDGGRVVGLYAQRDGRDFFIRATRGALLATGGFEWNKELTKRYQAAPPMQAFTPATNDGDGLLMGIELGAATALMDCSVWIGGVATPGEAEPVFNAATAFGYPGGMIVNRYGKRCCNESFYPAVAMAMRVIAARKESEFANLPMYGIADQSFRDKHNIGPAPAGREARPWLKSANTLRDLAQQINVPATEFEETVLRFNEQARRGVDAEFGRGAYVAAGAASVMGPLESPPFYAARMALGTVGHRGGLVTNAQAQVLNVRGEVLPGLYAASNVAAQTPFGGGYSSGQCNGLSIVFGCIAAEQAAAR